MVLLNLVIITLTSSFWSLTLIAVLNDKRVSVLHLMLDSSHVHLETHCKAFFRNRLKAIACSVIVPPDGASQCWHLWINAYSFSIQCKQLFLGGLVIECVALKERNGVTTKGGRRVIFCSHVEGTMWPGLQWLNWGSRQRNRAIRWT